jgi:hypothetical protein
MALRWYKVCVTVAVCAAITPFVIAAPAGAATDAVDLLGGHGNFEAPVVPNPPGYEQFSPPSSFDGWQVSQQPVFLSRTVGGISEVPQGQQALALVAAGGGAALAGSVCRPVATIAGHRYRIVFQATSAVSGPSTIIAKLGARSKSVSAQAGAFFKPFSLKLRAAVADAQLCFTATLPAAGYFPSIDAARVFDLGP